MNHRHSETDYELRLEPLNLSGQPLGSRETIATIRQRKQADYREQRRLDYKPAAKILGAIAAIAVGLALIAHAPRAEAQSLEFQSKPFAGSKESRAYLYFNSGGPMVINGPKDEPFVSAIIKSDVRNRISVFSVFFPVADCDQTVMEYRSRDVGSERWHTDRVVRGSGTLDDTMVRLMCAKAREAK